MLSKSFSFHLFTWSCKLFQFCLMEKPGLGQSTFLAKHFVTASPSPNLLLIFSRWRKRRGGGGEGHALRVGMRDLTSSREFLLWSLAGCSNDTNRVQLPSHACNIIRWSSSYSCQLGLCFQCYQGPTYVFSKEGAIPEMFEKVCFRLYQRVFL